MATKNQPVKEVRLGRIKAVIWKNPGSNGNGPMFNTTLARLYKDPEADAWKETQSLGREDLLLAARTSARLGRDEMHFSLSLSVKGIDFPVAIAVSQAPAARQRTARTSWRVNT